MNLCENNGNLAGKLKKKNWNTTCFGNVFRKKDRLKARIKGIQKHLEKGYSKGLIKLDEVLYQEELHYIGSKNRKRNGLLWVKGPHIRRHYKRKI